MLVILFLSIIFCVRGHPFIKRPGDCRQFTYDDHDLLSGPSVWGSICEADHMCVDGKSQSPINIDYAFAKADHRPLQLSLKDANGTIFYNNGLPPDQKDGLGFTGSLSFTSPKNAIYGGPLPADRGFQILRFHFHAESEHTIEGKRYPLELHVVLSDTNKKLAVLGFLFEVRKSHPFLANLAGLIEKYSVLPEITHFLAGEIKLEVLLDEVKSFVSYNGSLTTPPCSEDVTWILSTTILSASQEELDIITAGTPMQKNYRPVQPLNSRTLTIHPSAGLGWDQPVIEKPSTPNSSETQNSIYAVLASLLILAISSLAAVRTSKVGIISKHY